MASILIVDDDEDLRPMLVSVLVDAGHEVRSAGDGGVALRLLKQAPADLVVTDLVMPEKEGLELIQEVRQLFPHLKVIAMSGGVWGPRHNFLPVASRLGADRVLAKPFSVHTFMDLVSEVLRM